MWVRDGGILEGRKGWEWSPLGLPRFFPNLEKGSLLFLTVEKTTQVRVISFDPPIFSIALL
jgi:hypothetical protein